MACTQVRVEVLEGDVGLMDVIIVDKTQHLVDGKSDVKRVRVPRGLYRASPGEEEKEETKKERIG